MKKIPNLFERDWNGDKSRVLPKLNPDADVSWVLRGEGVPTVKWDGSAVLVRDGKLFVRYDLKKDKPAPAGFEPCQEKDSKTGHMPGWLPAEGNPAAKWHMDAFLCTPASGISDGTYEACGPQHQSNPYGFPRNLLIRHGENSLMYPWDRYRSKFGNGPGTSNDADVWHDDLSSFLTEVTFQHPDMIRPLPIEGIVWHHPDGRMVKVLASDLGLPWKGKVR